MPEDQPNPFAPEQPQETPPTQEPAPVLPTNSPTPRKSHKKLYFLITVVVVVLGAAAAVFFFNATPKESASTNNKDTVTTVDQALDIIRGAVTGVSEVGDTGMTTPPIKVSGRDYYVGSATLEAASAETPITQGTNLSFVVDIDSQNPSIKAIDAALTGAGLTSTDRGEYTAYQNNSIVCSVSKATNLPGTTSDIYTTCLEMAIYNQAAQDLAPIVTAYASAHDNVATSDLIFTFGEVNDGTKGYKHALVATSNFVREVPTGMSEDYYYMDADGAWHYFHDYTATLTKSGALDCSLYNTSALKNAFSGTYCTENGSMVTLQ